MKKILLISIIVLAVLIRAFHAPTRTYFNNCDELITATTCSGLVYASIPSNTIFSPQDAMNPSLKTTLHNCAFGGYGGDNGNCYFFNLVLTFWTKIFGISEMAFRAFSMLCDVLSIILIFSICGLLKFNPASTALSGLLLAINPVFVAFGGDFIRTYSFVTLLVLISLYCFLKAYKNPENKKFYFLLALTTFLAFFSHFLSYYIFLPYILFAFLKRKQLPGFFKKVSLFLIATGIICIGILSLNKDGIADMKKRNSDLEARASVAKPTAATEQFNAKTIAFASIKYFLSYYTGNFSLTGFANGLGLKIIPFFAFIVFLLLPVLLFISHFKELKTKDTTLILWLVVLSGNVSAFLIMFLSKHFTSLDIRYSIFTMPVFFILAGHMTSKRLIYKAIPYVLILLSGIALIGTYNRNISKEISIDLFDGSKKNTVLNIPDIKNNFNTKLQSLNASDILGFNNPDDFIFYILLTEGKFKNACIIDKNLPQGLSCQQKTEFLIPYKYYGTD